MSRAVTETQPATGTESRAAFEQALGATEQGLSRDEAARRLARYGPNAIPERHVSPLRQVLAYLWGPIPWMIEVAAVLSLLVRHWPDFAIILTLLVVNAAVGFWEEYQAGNAVAALKAQLALQARVRRDGAWTTCAARDLVPGDRIRLRIGDVVPADARLLDGDPLEVDQSALTGESLPVTRGPDDTVYSGSIVKRGEIDALVAATGVHTYFGKTAQLVETAHTVSHFQRAVLRIGNFLIVIAVSLAIVILSVALVRGDDLMTTLEFALVLTVAAIPVAMPTVLSVTMAVGARHLARRQAIVTHLAAVEELAGIDVLCSDKTGTLTQNRLTLGEPFSVAGATPVEVLQSAALASRAEDQDPIDLAVLGGLPPDQPASGQILHFQPFDPVGKRTEATVGTADGKTWRVTKGAPQVILALATNADTVQPAVEQAVAAFAARGFRALGVARTDAADAWQFLGVLPLYDPPRPDSRAMLSAARDLGITVKLLTGDQLPIAREIAGQLGLGSDILDAARLDAPAADQVAGLIEQADGFAQVFPEHKFRIVQVLQQRGHIVGMTGDGVNDAPPLKQADAGIAVSGATDAARAAAAIVLLTPGLGVIVEAIKASREIFQRMTSYAIYRIAETIRVLLFLTLAITLFNFYPVTAVMIVLLAVLNDGAIISIAYDHVHAATHPEAWDMGSVLFVATALGVAGVLESFLLFVLAERVFHLDQATIQTLIYLKLSVAGHLTIFAARTRGPFWSIRPAPVLLGAVAGTQLVATTIALSGFLMHALPWPWALAVWGYALAWFLVEDRVKLLAYRVLDRRRARRPAASTR